MLQREELKKVAQDMSRRVGSLAVFIFVHLIILHLITIIDGELNLSEYLTNRIIPIHQTSWFGSRLSEYLNEPCRNAIRTLSHVSQLLGSSGSSTQQLTYIVKESCLDFSEL